MENPQRPVLPALLKRLPASGLLLMSSIAAVDGTVLMLAATGTLSTWSGALVTGLTVIAGVGAWLAARREFGGRVLRRDDRLLLALVAGVGTLAVLAAAALGAWVAGSNVELRVLPKGAGVALLLLSVEVAGLRLPRLGPVPWPALAVVAALALEAGLRWIP